MWGTFLVFLLPNLSQLIVLARTVTNSLYKYHFDPARTLSVEESISLITNTLKIQQMKREDNLGVDVKPVDRRWIIGCQSKHQTQTTVRTANYRQP